MQVRSSSLDSSSNVGPLAAFALFAQQLADVTILPFGSGLEVADRGFLLDDAFVYLLVKFADLGLRLVRAFSFCGVGLPPECRRFLLASDGFEQIAKALERKSLGFVFASLDTDQER